MSTKKLKIAKGLALDPDAATKTFAILAQRRKGKTYTASIFSRECESRGGRRSRRAPTFRWRSGQRRSSV
jgi:hypothetical protein